MDLEKLFLTRQSTRSYQDREVDDSILERICKLAMLAPSAVNCQPYDIYAIKGEKADDFTRNIQIKGSNGWANTCHTYLVIAAHRPIVVQRPNRSISNEEYIDIDVGILAAYLTLAAENEGVQSCIVGLRNETAIAKFLDLPIDTKFPLVIALGYKEENYPLREKHRRDFDKVYTLIK